jgi:hypothetical protein
MRTSRVRPRAPASDHADGRFEEARRQFLPFAEAHGYLTDEDVFRDVT